MTVHPRFALLAAVALAWLTGCASPYYRVESRLVEGDRVRGAAEVTETPAYRAFIGSVRVVGLRPPDDCQDGTIAAGTRSESGDARMIRTRCGVEMAEFERALAGRGYTVISWDLIRRKAETEELPALVAARAVGVDAMLQVNAWTGARRHRDATPAGSAASTTPSATGTSAIPRASIATWRAASSTSCARRRSDWARAGSPPR